MATKSYFKRKKIIYYPVKNKYQPIVSFLSKWEYKYANFLDNDSDVVSWTHDFPIAYYDQYVSKKVKKYLVDFFVHRKKRKQLIEIKPKFFLKSKSNSKSTIWRAHHTRNYLMNLSKWEAAYEYAQKKDWDFFIVSFENNKFEIINYIDIRDKLGVEYGR